MQAIWVLTVLAVASADVSHLGYHYRVPQTTFGVPSYQVGGSNGHYHSGFGSSGHGVSYKGSEGQYLGSSFSRGDQGAPSHLTGDAQLSASNLYGGVSSVFGSGLGNGYASGFGNKYSSGLNSGFGGDSGLSSGQYYHTVGGPSTVKPFYQTVGGPSTVQPIYFGGSNEYQTTNYNAGEKYQQFYQVQSNEPTQVYKHFYVHSAPEEQELPKPRTPIVISPRQKHYKIIFVKTPNVESHSSQIVPVQPQTEEKTIVYVLVKKPEEHHEVLLPKVEQKPPTKPDVYFIKYNNKEDSQAVINNIVNDYNKPGQSVSYATGGSESSSVSGLPFSQSSGSGYISGSSGLSDFPSSGFSTPTYPSVGISNGFTKFPSSSSGSNLGFTSGVPTIIGSSINRNPSSFSTGSNVPITGLFNRFGSSSDLNSGLSSDSGSNSGLSGGSTSGLNNGFGLPSLFGSSQSDASVQAPIVSSSVSTQSFDENSPAASDASNDAGTAASSLFSGVSPSFSTTSSEAVQEDSKIGSATQGLPHETYGVPKFRIV